VAHARNIYLSLLVLSIGHTAYFFAVQHFSSFFLLKRFRGGINVTLQATFFHHTAISCRSGSGVKEM